MKLSVAGLADLARGNQSRLTAPIDCDPREGSSADMEERVFQVLQRGASVEFRGPSTPPRVGPAVEGSPLGYVRSRNREFLVAPLRKDDFWRDGTPPAWAADWGEDEFGRWIAFEFEGVRQRMRWVEPGTFRMGSPEDEPGRYEEGSDWNEGPQHEVTISRGFWLFDTACTQALWQAVKGHNPSRFQSPDRPVEQVSWEDCQTFLTQINERVPGLDLCLPTEAQWEYACRAGSDTATYAGPIEIVGDNNAPAPGGRCGAAAGTATRGTCGARAGARAPPATATTSSAFALPEFSSKTGQSFRKAGFPRQRSRRGVAQQPAVTTAWGSRGVGARRGCARRTRVPRRRKPPRAEKRL